MRPEVVAIAGLLASGCAGRTMHRTAGGGSAQASIDAATATGGGSAPDPSGPRDATRSLGDDPPAGPSATFDAATSDAPTPDAAPRDARFAAEIPPCDRACTRLLECTPGAAQPLYAHCRTTCDARRAGDLLALSTASCAMVEQALAAGGSPIERRGCAAMIASHRVTAAPHGRREALVAHEWCVRHGAGALGTTSVQWNANGVMRWENGEACWTLDGGRLTWTLDGVTWRALAMGWRGDAELVAGAQRLVPCPPERPERPRPID